MVEDLDLCVFRFTEYNRDFIKSCKISPDVYVQLVMQLAYFRWKTEPCGDQFDSGNNTKFQISFRLHGTSVATYESAGLRRFALGRVDCIRSASVEALAWAKAMCQGDPNGQSPSATIEHEEGAKRVQFTIYSVTIGSYETSTPTVTVAVSLTSHFEMRISVLKFQHSSHLFYLRNIKSVIFRKLCTSTFVITTYSEI